MGVFQKIRNSFLIDTYFRIVRLLTRQQRQKAVYLTFLTIVGAATEVLGLAALVPVMLAATDPGWVQRNEWMQWIYQAGGFSTNANFMVFLSLVLLAVFIIKNLIALYLYHLQSRFAFEIGTDLSRRQFIKFYNRGFVFFKNTNSAEIVNQVMNIPTFFTSAILVSAINFFCEALVVLLVVAGIAVTDYRLFFALVVILVPSGFVIYNLTKNKLYEMGLQQADMYNSVYNKLQQSIFGYTDVRLNNKERVFLDAYTKLTHNLNRSYQFRFVVTLIPPRALEVIAILGITITFIYTFMFMKEPEQLYSFIAVFAAAAFRILPSFNRLLQALMGIKSHQYALDFLEDGELPQELTKIKVEPFEFKESIDVRNLSFSFEGNSSPAIHNINFSVKKGEKIGIIGESGSGKTTLMNILLRFLEEESGGVYVDGRQILPDDKASWRALVGYVKQDVYLMDATLKENVAFGETPEQIDEARLNDALEKASLSKFVESLPDGLNTIVGELGSKVSGGQKQRLGIARALYAKAQVLVFDEATSALDNDTEQAITDSIENIDGGQTIFVIAHRITTLRFCDRILEMKNGEIVGVHTYAEIMARR